MDFVNGFGIKGKLILLSVVVLLPVQGVQSKHDHKSTVFHDLTVSIHHSIPQDNNIIPTLQDVLTKASKIFHKMTSNLILSERIQIVIPNTWTYNTSGKSYNIEEFSDIRLESYHLAAERKHTIHTIQPGECGYHGDHITMRPNFLHNKSIEHSASQLLQEIIRYKFGIFEKVNLTKESSEHPEKLQQMMCHRKSGWHVFKHALGTRNGLKHLGFKVSEEFKEPVFDILRTEPATANIFLLDGSNDFWNKTTIMPTMLRYLESSTTIYAAGKSLVGYVLYSDNARILKNLTEPENQITGESLHELFDKEEKGKHKNLIAGFEKCLEELRTKNLPTLGARIILLTDTGWDIPHMEAAEYTHQLAQLLISNGIVLHSLVIGTNLHHHRQKLQELSHDTRGQFYVIKDEDHMIKHGMELLATIEPGNVMVSSEEFTVQSKHLPFRTEVLTDDGMESTLYISINKDNAAVSKNIEVISPQGVSVNSSHTTHQLGRLQLVYKIYEAGKWAVQVTDVDKEKNLGLQVQVISQAAINPVRLSAWIKQPVMETPALQIFAQIKFINKLHHLKVTAEVIDPAGTSTHIKLKDSGIGADRKSGDGIYSAYSVHFPRNGKYEVSVRVFGKQNYNQTGNQTELFERYAYAGQFWIHSENMNFTDRIPPAPIRDLTVANHNDKDIIKLNWTAVGDNMDYGKAASYELRITNSHKETLFEKWHRILPSDILGGSLETLPSGQTQKVTFAIPTEMFQQHRSSIFHIAIKTHDHNNNPSSISNIVIISITDGTATGSTIDLASNHGMEHSKVTPGGNYKTTSMAANESEILTTSVPSDGKKINSVNGLKVFKEGESNKTTVNQTITTTGNVLIFTSPVTIKQTRNDRQQIGTSTETTMLKSDGKTTSTHRYIQKNPEIKILNDNTENELNLVSISSNNTEANGNNASDFLEDRTNCSTAAKDTTQEKVRFASINMRVSTIVASFVAGITGTFFVMVIVAAYVKNKKKDNTYNIKKSEEDFIERMALKEEAV